MYFAYILQSEKDGSYYIGSTSNLDERIKRHNSRGSGFTKNRIPYKLAYRETFSTLSEARKREAYLKSLKSRRAIEKIMNNAPFV